MRMHFRRWLDDQDGQDLVEYLLLGGALALAGLVGRDAIQTAIQTVYAGWDGGTQAIWEPQNPQ